MTAMAHPLFDIDGKLAVVTGSSRGIGFALARGLLQAGTSVVLNGRGVAALAVAVAELAAEDPAWAGRVHPVPFDVTSEAAVTEAVRLIERDIGPIDILVSNAGTQLRGTITDYPLTAWNDLVATNLTSAFLVGREVARHMVPRGRGKIINIASLQSEASRPGIAPYAATKGGIKMLTKGMCADLAGHGIQVNAIGPGYFVTDLNASLKEDAAFDAWLTRRTPAGRWGQPHELVGTLLYLASPASDFVNGQTIYVDGGVLAVL